MEGAMGESVAPKGPITGSSRGRPEPVIVPGKVQIERSGFLTKEDAARDAGATYGANGVSRKQEVQLGLIRIAPDNWGYLTPGWGPVGATRVDSTALFDAYRATGLKVHAWMHGHWDQQLNFSATDFPLVWGKPNVSTFLINSAGEVRVLRHSHLDAGLQAMQGSTFKQNLQGLMSYYAETGLPGEKL